MSRPTWLRANRWWLLVLPFAVVLMLGASSYRVSTFWWDNGFHDETGRAQPGKPLKVVNHFTDGVGDTTRTFRVAFTGLDEVDEIPNGSDDPAPVPDDMTAYKVRLDFSADPLQDMNYCVLSLVDRDGNQYRIQSTGDPTGQSNVCVPEGARGPKSPLLKGEKRGVVEPGTDRPATWSVDPTMLVKEGAHLTELRVAFSWPEFVVLPMPR